VRVGELFSLCQCEGTRETRETTGNWHVRVPCGSSRFRTCMIYVFIVILDCNVTFSLPTWLHDSSTPTRPLRSGKGLLLRLVVAAKLLFKCLLAEVFKFCCLQALRDDHAGLLLRDHLHEPLARAVHHALLYLRGCGAGVHVHDLCCAAGVGVEAETRVGLRQCAGELGGGD
jgi:hypothetical protein